MITMAGMIQYQVETMAVDTPRNRRVLHQLKNIAQIMAGVRYMAQRRAVNCSARPAMVSVQKEQVLTFA